MAFVPIDRPKYVGKEKLLPKQSRHRYDHKKRNIPKKIYWRRRDTKYELSATKSMIWPV